MKKSFLKENAFFVNISFMILYLFWIGLGVGLFCVEIWLLDLIPREVINWFFEKNGSGFFPYLFWILKTSILIFLIFPFFLLIPWVIWEGGCGITKEMYNIIKRTSVDSDAISK